MVDRGNPAVLAAVEAACVAASAEDAVAAG